MSFKIRYLKIRVVLSLLAAVLLIIAPFSAGAEPATIKATVVLSGASQPEKIKTLTLEIARTENEHARGLMYRREMARDSGMLFIFSENKERSFWMKNTPLSLDLIFLDDRKTVVGVAANATPFSTEGISVNSPSRYVIEVNAGVAKELGIITGSKINF